MRILTGGFSNFLPSTFCGNFNSVHKASLNTLPDLSFTLLFHSMLVIRSSRERKNEQVHCHFLSLLSTLRLHSVTLVGAITLFALVAHSRRGRCCLQRSLLDWWILPTPWLSCQEKIQRLPYTSVFFIIKQNYLRLFRNSVQMKVYWNCYKFSSTFLYFILFSYFNFLR